MPTKYYQTDLLKRLANREYAAQYLKAALVINNISLEYLQKLFGINSENPMYDCYPVKSAEQISYLQNLLNFELDTKSYNYFIECDRT